MSITLQPEVGYEMLRNHVILLAVYYLLLPLLLRAIVDRQILVQEILHILYQRRRKDSHNLNQRVPRRFGPLSRDRNAALLGQILGHVHKHSSKRVGSSSLVALVHHVPRRVQKNSSSKLLQSAIMQQTKHTTHMIIEQGKRPPVLYGAIMPLAMRVQFHLVRALRLGLGLFIRTRNLKKKVVDQLCIGRLERLFQIVNLPLSFTRRSIPNLDIAYSLNTTHHPVHKHLTRSNRNTGVKKLKYLNTLHLVLNIPHGLSTLAYDIPFIVILNHRGHGSLLFRNL
ncbi:hypothetical protein IW262DRAFT_1360550 [Armillaria fumosa]|nr:hypothetical protein IW262DRAFT_1360550 [Armillaria fumosa]